MRILPLASVLGLALTCGPGPAAAQSAGTAGETKIHQWWQDRFPGEPLKSPNAAKLPAISVRGNRFVDQQGNPVLFRGLSISDPDKIENQGHWNKELFVEVQQTGARLVRIPLHGGKERPRSISPCSTRRWSGVRNLVCTWTSTGTRSAT